jgi:hypothetical protein
LLFFEFNGFFVNAVQLHVYDADVLVRRGVQGTASDNRRYGAPARPIAVPVGAVPKDRYERQVDRE